VKGQRYYDWAWITQPLTCNEIRRLFTIFVTEPGRTIACPLAWSTWRRRHQHRARTSHYQQQATQQP
jgi:hypothetical protein